jgi:hypothetical protein
LRLINPDDPKIVGTAGAQIVIGGIGVAVSLRVSAFLVGASESATGDLQFTDRLAILTFQNLAIARQWLSIEAQNLRGRVAGYVIGDRQPEVGVARTESQIECSVVVQLLIRRGAGIARQPDI